MVKLLMRLPANLLYSGFFRLELLFHNFLLHTKLILLITKIGFKISLHFKVHLITWVFFLSIPRFHLTNILNRFHVYILILFIFYIIFFFFFQVENATKKILFSRLKKFQHSFKHNNSVHE